MKMHFAGFLLLATCFLGLATPAWSIETRPDTLVDKTAQEVLAIVRQDKEIQAGNTARILDLVEAKILPHFDFTRMTRLAMGSSSSNTGSSDRMGKSGMSA